VEKVVLIVKDKRGIALERFIFSIRQMIELESYDRDQKYEIKIFLCFSSSIITLD